MNTKVFRMRGSLGKRIVQGLLLGLGLVAATLTAHAETFTVINTNDAGAGSLRDAIEQANLTVTNADTIAFNIPGAGPHAIKPLSPLPTITSPVTIDGYTQPGASPNTEVTGNNAVLQIELDGSLAGRLASGLNIVAADSKVKGLAIYGFSFIGIILAGAGRDVISGNFIGIPASGSADMGNRYGIEIQENSSSNIIGGADPISRNVISGNTRTGITISNANRTKIEGNFIGTDKTGSAKLANGVGITIFRATGTSIGGTSPEQRNVISGNEYEGIRSQIGTEGVITGNFIGTDVSGTGALGNGGPGIIFEGETNSVVGQTTPGAGNIIANNGGSGINVTKSSGYDLESGVILSILESIGNSIRGNRIFKNGGLGIDLGADGVTKNDPAPDQDKGPNRLQNFPILSSVEASGTGLKVKGGLQSVPNTPFHIDFYGNEVRDPSGYGEGQFYLGTIDVTTDGKGEAVFEAALPASQGHWISSTATRAGTIPDTSEFSPVLARAGQEFGVNNTNPTGPGSFAQAVLDSNGTENPAVENRIFFDIPGSQSHVIDLAGVVTITQPAVIAGFTQPGAAPNTASTGFNGVVKIGLDGAGLESPMLNLSGDNITVQGLAFLNHQPSANIGAIQVTGNGNWISGNLIGLTPGSAVIPNRLGIGVFGEDDRIGGPDPGDRNVISGNTVAGVALGPGARRNLVWNNLIGTDLTGTLNRGNGDTGILLSSADQNRVENNVIAFNALRGVFISGTGTGNTISRNSIFENGSTAAIDLSPPTGVDTNDPLDADVRANSGQNYPDLASATIVNSIAIAGMINSTPDTEFRLEFFSNSSCSPSGFGEGRTFLGEALVVTDVAGSGAFSATLLDTVSPGQVITATATDPQGSTSEFSRCVTVTSGPPPAGTLISTLSPEESSNKSSGPHTVTATITSDGAPLANVPVFFNILSGPNSDQGGSGTTDSNGRAAFTYSNDGTPGTDRIVATGVAAGVQFFSSATVVWNPNIWLPLLFN